LKTKIFIFLLLLQPLLFSQSNLKSIINARVTNNIFRIQQSDLNQSVASLGSMYSISTAGYYYLVSDLSVAPTNTSVKGINITVDNVILDLNGKTFTQTNATAGFTAINSGINKKNISIVNGVIKNPTGIGVRFGGGNSNLEINQIKVIGFGETGIIIIGSISNNIIIDMVECTNGSSSGNIQGLSLVACRDVKLTNSFFNSNTSSGNSVTGVNIGSSGEVFIDNCHFDNNSVTGGNSDCQGIFINEPGTTIIRNCTFNRNSVTGAATGRTNGIRLDNSVACEITACTANENSSANSFCEAFFLNAGSYNILTSCVTNNNSAPSGNCIGVSLNASSYNVIDACIANHNSIGASASSSNSAIGFSVGGTTNLVKNCVANGNDASASPGNAFGFFCPAPANRHTLLNCIAMGNVGGTTSTTTNITTSIDGSKGSGFRLSASSPLTAGTVIQNCKAIGNTVAVTGGADGAAFGILIDATNGPLHIVRGCEIYANHASTYYYGYRDLSSDSRVALIGNVSMQQGKVNPGDSSSLSLLNNMNYMFNRSAGQTGKAIDEATNYNNIDLSSTTLRNISIGF
jgi:hypothetical protein